MILVLSVFVSNCNTAPEVKSVIPDKVLAVKVDGMVCAVGCAKYIEKEVAKMEGVSDCKVDFEHGRASISFSSTAQSQEKIIETISGLNDGQYQVSDAHIRSIQKKTEDRTSKKDEESTVTDVKFSFPELVTFFIGELTR